MHVLLPSVCYYEHARFNLAKICCSRCAHFTVYSQGAVNQGLVQLTVRVSMTIGSCMQDSITYHDIKKRR